MDIDTAKPHPKPAEHCVSLLKKIDKDLSDIKADILFIKSRKISLLRRKQRKS